MHASSGSVALLAAAALLTLPTPGHCWAPALLPPCRACRTAPTSPRCGAGPLRAAVASPPPVTGGAGVRIGGQFVNPVGLLFGFSTFFSALLVYPAIVTSFAASMLLDRKRRRAVDWVVHYWAKITVLSCGYRPKLVNAHKLPAHATAALYVPNHTSFFDILTLSGFIPRPMKYVSKVEILRIPLIGWAMVLAGHIPIRRSSRRSQLQTFKDTVASLQNGNSVVTFAEGKRSADGRLQAFKRGPFKMALRAGVPIVPVTVCDLHRWLPPGVLLPMAVPQGVEVVVHDPIEPFGKTEAELMRLTYDAVNSALPAYQRGRALPPPEVEGDGGAAAAK